MSGKTTSNDITFCKRYLSGVFRFRKHTKQLSDRIHQRDIQPTKNFKPQYYGSIWDLRATRDADPRFIHNPYVENEDERRRKHLAENFKPKYYGPIWNLRATRDADPKLIYNPYV
jgi:hypothetical protein